MGQKSIDGPRHLQTVFPPSEPPRSASAAFRPEGRRSARVFGSEAELVWVPGRARRRGSGEGPPAFRASPAPRILQQESLGEDEHTILTPNRFPFAEDHFLLWAKASTREASPELLARLFSTAERWDGTALLNSVGAASTIPHAHGHLTSERLPFLTGLETTEWQPQDVSLPAGVGLQRSAPPMPLVVVVRGEARARARAVHELQLQRLTAAHNLVAMGDTTWLWPRSAIETPAPSFPSRLGAAELWGRWCFVDEEKWRSATAADLEQALRLCGV